MNWSKVKPVWPHAETSRFVPCAPHEWHVQEMGEGPVALLLHGAGGATHSWRDILPGLARTHRTIAIDLPGQGFTRLGSRFRSGVSRTAEDIARLCAKEGWDPTLIVGHSAGAALALELTRHLPKPPEAVVGINAALEPFDGPARWMFPMMAKMLAMNPLTAPMVAATMSSDGVERLLNGTGSQLDAHGRALYRLVITDHTHVDGALTMMAQWDLDDLIGALPDIQTPTLLLTGDRDRAVDPSTSVRAAERLPNAQVLHLPDLGHLAHEEAPDLVLRQIQDFLGARQPVKAMSA